MRVIELQAKKWTVESSLLTLQASKLNTDAPEFVPSTEVQVELQQPVRNAGELISTQ